MIDLNTLSLPELQELQRQLPIAIESRRRSEKSQTLIELKALAAERGFSLSDLIGANEVSKRAPVAAKYANPSNRSETWTGRGRKPHWVIAHLTDGGTLESIAI